MTRWWAGVFGAVLVLAGVASIALAQAPAASGPPTDRLIVRFKADAAGKPVRSAVDAALEAELSRLAGTTLRLHRATGGRGEHVLKLERRLSVPEVEVIAEKLRAHPELDAVIPDRILFPQLTPNDPQFPSQWYLQSAEQGGINAPAAWDITTGSASVVVAVIDTGILPHADLAGRILPGYDFVSDPDRSNDGDGRDSNPTDPGDWVTAAEAASGPLAGCPVANSSWHGTRIAGIIAAAGNNAAGIAGINWNSKILPVRAIGKCGGYTSDIIDAMRWAAGTPVAGMPNNVNPARVINLSLATPGACDPAFQSAINEVTTRGTVVIAAAGNRGQNAANYTPASCNNVIAVGAVDRNGGLAAYSNTGPQITVSAPGGMAANTILSTSDSGTQSPANDSVYLASQGTSLAAAQVSAVASLMLSLKPSLAPVHVRDIIRNTARGFPTSTASLGSYTDCTTLLCGGGVLDADRALQAANSTGIALRQLAAIGDTSFGLRSDGTVWMWGSGAGGSPMRIPGLSGVVQIANRVALRSDGTGVQRSVIVPSPNCPVLFPPHAHTVPSERTANE